MCRGLVRLAASRSDSRGASRGASRDACGIATVVRRRERKQTTAELTSASQRNHNAISYEMPAIASVTTSKADLPVRLMLYLTRAPSITELP